MADEGDTPEVVCRRARVDVHGRGLLNIVERSSGLAATERKPRDSIEDRIGQLGAENAAAYKAGRQDLGHYTSKTAQMQYGEGESAAKTLSQQATRAVQPAQTAPSFEEYSLI